MAHVNNKVGTTYDCLTVLSTILPIMSNYLKQVLGIRSTEQPDDAMEKGRTTWSPSPAMQTLQPGVAGLPAIVGEPSFSFKEPLPTSKDRYTTPPPRNTSPVFFPATRTSMEVDDGPHGFRRPSEEPATPGDKVRIVQSNSPLAHTVSLVVFLVLY